MRKPLRTILLPLMLLAACAPVTDGPRVVVAQLTEPVSFYPQETGATWQYLPDTARLSEPRLIRVVEGPTVLNGRLVTGWRLLGRGIDEQNFMTYDAEGVRLWRTTKPGSIIDFDPPVREFPAQSELRVGHTWGGVTRASVVYPQARPEHRTATLDIRYEYTVVDSRTATVPAGDFTVFVIDFHSVTLDEEGNPAEELTQTIWFAPYVGEVRTENGYFLIETNFLKKADED
jgi:hypothetical protein